MSRIFNSYLIDSRELSEIVPFAALREGGRKIEIDAGAGNPAIQRGSGAEGRPAGDWGWETPQDAFFVEREQGVQPSHAVSFAR